MGTIVRIHEIEAQSTCKKCTWYAENDVETVQAKKIRQDQNADYCEEDKNEGHILGARTTDILEAEDG